MRVVHLFDRYLNSTMNWAWQLIRHTPGAEVWIAAPLILDNHFREPGWQYLESPWQGAAPRSEWQLPLWQRWQGRWLRPLYLRWLARELRRVQPEVLHAHFAQVGVWALPVARQLGCPLVVSFYGYDYEQLPLRKPAYARAYQQLFAEAALLLTEGPHGARVLEGMGCPASKIRVQPLGLDLTGMTAVPRRKPANTLRLVQAASFTAKKGQLDTLEAFRRALPQCPGMTLTLVGEPLDKQLVAEVDARIAALPEGRAQRLDFVPSGQFHEWLAQFDVFIHPSRYAPDRDCEGGAPVVLLDAQRMGLPVLSTTHCDIPQVVAQARSGLLSAEGEPQALAQGIRRFYAMPEAEYLRFSTEALALVHTRFDVRKLGEQLGGVYRGL
jgi:colanic acid/amylovoran biosynthesis glycosyltransferase